jgi:hypothetical protein
VIPKSEHHLQLEPRIEQILALFDRLRILLITDSIIASLIGAPGVISGTFVLVTMTGVSTTSLIDAISPGAHEEGEVGAGEVGVVYVEGVL